MANARRTHALWIAPLTALFALVGYFTLTVRVQALSDVPWLNLAVLVATLAGSLWALPEAWARGGVVRRCGAALGLGVSSLCSASLIYYCFFLSYGVPSANAALPAGEPLPAIELADHRAEPVDLAQLGQIGHGDTVLVFYRGHW